MKILNSTFGFIRGVLLIVSIAMIVAFGACYIAHIKPAKVVSESMEPTIHKGSVVLIDQKQTENLREGDIIAFMRNGEFITHRIVGISEEGYRTKGDNNKSEDADTVEPNDVVGKTIFSIPKAGELSTIIATKNGIIAMGILCFVLILSAFIPSDRKQGKEVPKNAQNKPTDATKDDE